MKSLNLLWILLALAAPPARGAEDEAVNTLISKVTSENTEVRYSARFEAPKVGARAVAALARLMDESQVTESKTGDVPRYRREVAITARAALAAIAHNAARPDADADRDKVAAEIGQALAQAQSLKLKRELLLLVGFVGQDREVPVVAKLLGDADPNVRETARLTLERIPGAAAVQALLDAAGRASDEMKPDLLFSVGKKGDRSAVAPLVNVAREGKGNVRMGAMEALAHLGAPEAIPLFDALLKEADAANRGKVWSEYLRLADNLMDGGKASEARTIYLSALQGATREEQRERALFRAAADGDVNVLLAGLADPGERVRRLALAKLGTMKGEEIVAILRKAYDRSKPEGKPALLRALAEKDRAAAEPLLAEAAGSPQGELKITALDIQDKLGNLDLEPTYLSLAKTGSAQVKSTAVKGYLLVARKRLEAGEKDRALEMYGNAIDLAANEEQRGAALQGLVNLDDPRSLSRLAALLNDPILGNDAGKGFVSIAGKLGAAGDKDAAEKQLMQVLSGNFSREVRQQAVEELRKMGRDPQTAVRAQGYIIDWWLLTPIQDPEGNGLEKKFFPEETIDLQNQTTYEGRRFRWQKLREISLDGRIDLLTSFRRSEKVLTYAYTEVDSAETRDVVFKMGSDDGMACWLNGERIHLASAPRGLTVDEDSVKAKLKAGKNKILLKIANTGGDWGFAFRVTDAEGKPLMLPVSK